MKAPTISVIMATYNHADFVAESIESALSQRGVDLELLVADDGSADSTREVVASIRDERLRFFPNAVNRGACAVTNELIQRASGEFIAVINSDDYWTTPDKLAGQLRVMRDQPGLGACFGRARFVDRNGRAIRKSTLTHGHVFDQPNRSRGAWLRQFFDRGNCLCHPTMLIRKSCYARLGMYDNRLRQLPDFDMWVRLAKRYDIHVSDDDLVAFRHSPGENASSATTVNMGRLMNETYFILQGFFHGMSREVFLDGFGDQMVMADLPDDAHMDIEQALLYLAKDRWSSHIYNLIGLERMHLLLGSDAHRQTLSDGYGIDDRAFYAMAADVDTFSLEGATGALSSVGGWSLIAEVKRRALLRTPHRVRSVMSRRPKRSSATP